MDGLTYAKAGVDIDRGDAFVERIKPLAARTRIPELLGGVGGFAGLCRVPSNLTDPVLVSGTDGVGTKLKIAFELDVHDTIGIDLVAMCVNDVLTTGARPLFFLDYFATSTLDVERASKVVEGISKGCIEAGCALLGGETAEMPGLYQAGEYDLAGFAVGVVERASVIDGQAIAPGHVAVAIRSSGLHSNGYSLARKALLERAKHSLHDPVRELGETLGACLLRPTRIYARAVGALQDAVRVRGLCHITGGGLPGNLPRILPPGLAFELRTGSWPIPPIFELIAHAGSISIEEMRRTFNLGVGMVVVVAPEHIDAALGALERAGETADVIGQVVPLSPDAERVVFI